ncbi:MAG: hypothetical protein NTV34_01920 [Proteobacteria bacterium]|nr:hypothetical protein [Pseudomonadota bacterium]
MTLRIFATLFASLTSVGSFANPLPTLTSIVDSIDGEQYEIHAKTGDWYKNRSNIEVLGIKKIGGSDPELKPLLLHFAQTEHQHFTSIFGSICRAFRPANNVFASDINFDEIAADNQTGYTLENYLDESNKFYFRSWKVSDLNDFNKYLSSYPGEKTSVITKFVCFRN